MHRDGSDVTNPFDEGGRWVLRYHIPYSLRTEAHAYRVVAGIYAAPEVRARVTVTRDDDMAAVYEDLSVGDAVDIAGELWHVEAVEYRTHVVLTRSKG